MIFHRNYKKLHEDVQSSEKSVKTIMKFPLVRTLPDLLVNKYMVDNGLIFGLVQFFSQAALSLFILRLLNFVDFNHQFGISFHSQSKSRVPADLLPKLEY